MKNLYRRYRPITLNDVVGQKQVTDALSNAISLGKISHAYLFIGPRGCGKTSVARILAHEINGFEYKIEDEYVDIIEIDGASNRGIDNIRELREKAAIAPTSGKYKVYIIDEVHMLTKEAFNALLKTLEEPPVHVIFIMATTDAYKVPVTITSRAQTYTFKLADPKTMFDFLKTIIKKEKINITDDALRVIVKKGGGSFRDSLSLLDQISALSSDEINKEMVIEAMGLPADEKIAELLAHYRDSDVVKITTVLKELFASGIKSEHLIEELINSIIDSPSPDLMCLLEKLADVREPFVEAKLLVAFTSSINVDASNTVASAKNAPVKNDSIVKQPNAFQFDDYLNKIKALNEVVFKQLSKCEHEFKDNTLHLYPRTKIVHNILNSKNNSKILIDNSGGFSVVLHEAGEHPESRAKDETLDKISAIMGGEVRNEGGYNPF